MARSVTGATTLISEMYRLTNRSQNRLRQHFQRAGTATVEFALVVPLLLVLLLGIVEFGLLFENFIIAKNAVREAARAGALGAGTSEIEDRVVEVAAGLNEDNITITQERGSYSEGSWTWQALGDQAGTEGTVNDAPTGSHVRISLSYPHPLLAASLVSGLEDEPGSGTITITADAVFRRE